MEVGILPVEEPGVFRSLKLRTPWRPVTQSRLWL